MLENLTNYSKRKEFRQALSIPMEAELTFSLLAQGEYNINYAFTHPVTGKKLLLRVNAGSQMHPLSALQPAAGWRVEAVVPRRQQSLEKKIKLQTLTVRCLARHSSD